MSPLPPPPLRHMRPLVLAVLVVLACLAAPGAQAARRQLGQWTYTTPPQALVSPVAESIMKREAKALLALKEALNNHPAFSGFQPGSSLALAATPHMPWQVTNIAQGNKTIMSYPCRDPKWAWVECDITARVSIIDLASSTIANPEVGGNSSWVSPGADPLTGSIPWEKMSALEKLVQFSLSYQNVGGNLTGVGGLTGLQTLALTSNKLTGSVPEDMGALTQLTSLALGMNQLSGPLPSTLGAVQSLRSLLVASNTLSGSFPAWLGNLTNLQTLELSSNPISGKLPDAWSGLSSLNKLLCQYTEVNGSVPESWSTLKALTHFNLIGTGLKAPFPAVVLKLPNISVIELTGNQLYGPFPTSLPLPLKLNTLRIDNNYLNGTFPRQAAEAVQTVLLGSNCFNSSGAGYVGRPESNCTAFYTALYAKPPPPAANSTTVVTTNNSKNSIIIITVVVVAFVLAVLGVLGYLYWRSQRKSSISKLFTKGLRQTSQEFTIKDLKGATQNWKTVIGKGGYGTVYKAELKDGSFVAVKRLDQVSKQGDVEFIREVELLSRVHHRHLVNLVGFCAERGERALVYEYMAMGSLYEHLHGDSAKQFPLSWDSRCKIAIHVALGIEYLHYGADPPLIHRDIKSANILLSDDGYSKVADFGLCKEAPVGAAADGSEQLVPTATAVRGSFGYLDPEYVNTSVLSEKSDVYSYGVVLLELISGHKSIHEWQPLAYWAEEYLADREKTPLMVDPALEGNFDLDELYALCDIARTCVQDQSASRPTIRDVAKALVENLGHGMSSFTDSQQDSASIMPSSQSDASSMPSTTYTPSSAEASKEFTYQNYSETLHWTPDGSGNMSSKNGSGLTVSTGTKGDRLPVPVPRRPDEGPKKPEDGDHSNDDVEKGAN